MKRESIRLNNGNERLPIDNKEQKSSVVIAIRKQKIPIAIAMVAFCLAVIDLLRKGHITIEHPWNSESWTGLSSGFNSSMEFKSCPKPLPVMPVVLFPLLQAQRILMN